MVKGYTIYKRSDAYGSSLLDVVIGGNPEHAFKTLLRHIKNTRFNFEYYIFDFDCIKLDLGDEYIKFELEDDFVNHFNQFCQKTFGELKCLWTYTEFKNHLDSLKEFIVYDLDMGDDPFCSFHYIFLEIDVNPNQSQDLEVIEEEESINVEYNVTCSEEARRGEFEINGVWHIIINYPIKIAG
jgi:hypothetical protein